MEEDKLDKKRICVVGAGAAGLAAIRNIKASNGLIGTVFEGSGNIGGVWKDDGSTPIYKGLRTNLPKHIMGFLDFTFSTEPGTDSFLTHNEVLNFLNSFADRFNLRDYIRLNTRVVYVRPVKKLGAHKNENNNVEWEVTYETNSPREDEITPVRGVETFDAIAICNGHFCKPFVPNLEQLSAFTGELIYSRDYSVPEPFSGKNVLIYGGGPSGIDIMLEIVNLASQVAISLRKPPYKGILPENISQKPPIKHVQGFTVTFEDETRANFDVILICIGYEYDLPFLILEECGLMIENGKFISPLYRHMINIAYPSMALIGLQFRICPFMLFDSQTRYFVKLLEGKANLPSETDMLATLKAEKQYRLDKGIPFSQSHRLEELQWSYMTTLGEDGNFLDLLKDLSVIRKVYEKVAQRRGACPALYKNDHIEILDNESFNIVEAV